MFRWIHMCCCHGIDACHGIEGCYALTFWRYLGHWAGSLLLLLVCPSVVSPAWKWRCASLWSEGASGGWCLPNTWCYFLILLYIVLFILQYKFQNILKFKNYVTSCSLIPRFMNALIWHEELIHFCFAYGYQTIAHGYQQLELSACCYAWSVCGRQRWTAICAFLLY